MAVRRQGICLLLIGLCATLAGSCTSTSLTTTNPSLPKCGVALTAPDTLVVASGGAVTIDVTTAPECAWSVSKEANWIASVSPTSGQGTGRISVQVMANPDATMRQTDVDINGQRASVRQEAAACQFSISPQAVALGAAAASTAVTVTATASCSWTAVSNVPWLAVTGGAAGTGTGEVTVNAQANAGATRVGTVTIGGQTFTVAQSATATVPCQYSISTPSQTIAAAGGPITVAVTPTSGSGCVWAASSNVPWLTITSGSTGIGAGTVSITVAINAGGARSGTLTVAGQTFTVNQAAASVNCTYAINPSSQNNVAGGGGSGTPIAVSTSTGCAWTSTSNASWITITGGATGSGNGTVTFTVAANNGPARTGTLTAAGKTFTVTQAANCVYGVVPLSQTVGSDAGPGQPITVSAVTGCTWTARSNDGWITITSGSNGDGNGSVAFKVSKHNSTRIGTLTVAGQTVTVTQQ